jgi:hypothetical protein
MQPSQIIVLFSPLPSKYHKNYHTHRRYAEYSGYWQSTTLLLDVQEQIKNDKPVTFYDSGYKGKPLFTAPRDRSWDDFITESKHHGWPSFRDSEVNWDYVRVLPDGETVSIDGTHLGYVTILLCFRWSLLLLYQ